VIHTVYKSDNILRRKVFTTMNKKEEAILLHEKGHNCAQSVACPFSKELGVDTKEVFKLAEAFGLGMGSMGTCGAVTAMALVVGMKMSDGNMEDPKTKRECYEMMKKLTEEFEKKNKSIVCSEIRGVETGEVLRSCDGCVEDAIELLEKNLFK
jgi:C_GCAxxG_C_C family probable redox protein